MAALTALVFLIRAGGNPEDAANWPVQWELRSSDNGVLFQLMQDVAAGRPLDWVFSPQLFVFPELPLSALGFALAAGNVFGYYLAVAVLNNVLLFVALVGLVRVLFPQEGSIVATVRGGIATIPLLVLPLIGTSWIFSFHLAPSYYFGMYLVILAGPILLLTRSRAVRVVLSVAVALTCASNPLTLLFVAPGTAVAFALLLIRRGGRAIWRPAAGVGAILVATLAVRLALAPLQGTSPFTYVDRAVFARRLAEIVPYYEYQARDPGAAVILVLGAVLAIVSLIAALVVSIVFVRRREPVRMLAVVYFGLVPLGGLGLTFAMMITHYLYFWPVLILPLVLWSLALPRGAVSAAGVVGAAAFSAAALATGAAGGNLGHPERYFGYRNDETRCIAAAVPRGAVGYATFSDARRLSLPSSGDFRLLPLFSDTKPHLWLTNRATLRDEAGTFFYLNGSGDELPIDASALRQEFGDPNTVTSCSSTQTVWGYTSATQRARIAHFYGIQR